MKLAAARLWAVNRAPYLSHALLALQPHAHPGLGTMAVTSKGVLLIDPVVLAQWTASQAGSMLTHETLHMVLEHHARAEHCNAHDQRAWNYAADAEINDDLLLANYPLPGKPVTPQSLHCRPFETAEVYYQEQRQQQAASASNGGEPGESSAESQEGASPSPGNGEAPGPGWCGSGAGRPVPGEDAALEQPGAPPGCSAPELAVIRRAVAAAITEASKTRGSVPAGLQRWAERFAEPAKVSWQTVLMQLVRSACARISGSVDTTYQRRSRRQAGLSIGGALGAPVLPALYAPVPRVAVVLDTSGSTGERELGAAMTELGGILQTVRSEVQWCACDAAVHELLPVVSTEQAMHHVRGGGGTDFRPAFAALAALPKQKRPQVVVFATDGQGPAPEQAPPGMEVVWLLLGDGARAPASWGTVIALES